MMTASAAVLLSLAVTGWMALVHFSLKFALVYKLSLIDHKMCLKRVYIKDDYLILAYGIILTC